MYCPRLIFGLLFNFELDPVLLEDTDEVRIIDSIRSVLPEHLDKAVELVLLDLQICHVGEDIAKVLSGDDAGVAFVDDLEQVVHGLDARPLDSLDDLVDDLLFFGSGLHAVALELGDELVVVDGTTVVDV